MNTAQRIQALIPKAELMRGDVVEVMIGQPAEVVLPRMKYFPEWEQRKWPLGENLMYKGQAYKVVQAHDSTGNATFNPTVASLFMLWHGISKETALPFKPVTGAHDMYKKNEWMIFTDGFYYKCLADTNYSPTEYPQAWKKG